MANTSRVLLDTHVFLWAILEPERLSRTAKSILLDEDKTLLLSAASIWEIQLNRRAGKLFLPEEPRFLYSHATRLGVREILSVSGDQADAILSLPKTHKDPFDCLLASQCLSESISIISHDPCFEKLGVSTIW